MQSSQPLVSPPCWSGQPHSAKQARRELRRTCNGLGLLLFCCSMGYMASSLLLPKFLNLIGYQGSLLYANYGYLQPTLYYLLKGAAFCISFFLTGLLYLPAARMPLSRSLPSQKVKPSVWIALLFMGFAMALMANLPVNWIGDWIDALFPQTPSTPAPSVSSAVALSVPAIVLYVVRSTVLPAFYEEFIFRGILLGQLRRYGDSLAIVVSAFFFGIFHSSPKQVPFAFLVGLVLAFIVVRTNHIWLSCAIHFCNNAFACFPDVLKPILSTQTYQLVYSCTFYGVMIVGALAALFLLWKHRSFFLPVSPARTVLSLPGRLAAICTAPALWLSALYCTAETVFPWF